MQCHVRYRRWKQQTLCTLWDNENKYVQSFSYRNQHFAVGNHMNSGIEMNWNKVKSYHHLCDDDSSTLSQVSMGYFKHLTILNQHTHSHTQYANEWTSEHWENYWRAIFFSDANQCGVSHTCSGNSSRFSVGLGFVLRSCRRSEILNSH